MGCVCKCHDARYVLLSSKHAEPYQLPLNSQPRGKHFAVCSEWFLHGASAARLSFQYAICVHSCPCYNPLLRLGSRVVSALVEGKLQPVYAIVGIKRPILCDGCSRTQQWHVHDIGLHSKLQAHLEQPVIWRRQILSATHENVPCSSGTSLFHQGRA